MQRNNNSIMIFENISGGKKLTGWGKNGPAYFFPIANSYNYRTFYFPEEGLPLSYLNTHMQIYDLMIFTTCNDVPNLMSEVLLTWSYDLFICQYKNLKDRI